MFSISENKCGRISFYIIHPINIRTLIFKKRNFKNRRWRLWYHRMWYIINSKTIKFSTKIIKMFGHQINFSMLCHSITDEKMVHNISKTAGFFKEMPVINNIWRSKINHIFGQHPIKLPLHYSNHSTSTAYLHPHPTLYRNTTLIIIVITLTCRETSTINSSFSGSTKEVCERSKNELTSGVILRHTTRSFSAWKLWPRLQSIIS